MRYEALARENGELRGLREALPPVAERWLRRRDRQHPADRPAPAHGRSTAAPRNGVFKGQAVLDDKGLLGQTIHVGPWSAEVILITDPEHAVPVQVERTGLRTIAVGAGDSASLALPYLPANADVKVGRPAGDLGPGRRVPGGLPGGARHRSASRCGAAARPGARRRRWRASSPTARSCWSGSATITRPPARRRAPQPNEPAGGSEERRPVHPAARPARACAGSRRARPTPPRPAPGPPPPPHPPPCRAGAAMIAESRAATAAECARRADADGAAAAAVAATWCGRPSWCSRCCTGRSTRRAAAASPSGSSPA